MVGIRPGRTSLTSLFLLHSFSRPAAQLRRDAMPSWNDSEDNTPNRLSFGDERSYINPDVSSFLPIVLCG
jgi:hypothetical protein